MEVLIGIFVVLLSALLLYFNSKSRRIKHALKWVPTPPGLPIIGHILQIPDSAALLRVTQKYAEQYGGIYRLQLGPHQILMLTDSKYSELILSSNKILTKSIQYKFLQSWLATGLLTSTGSKWRQRRKIITPAFHFSILNEFVPVFDEHGAKLIEKLNRENVADKDYINVFPYITLCALDIICETAMGVSLSAQSHEDSDYVRSVKTMLRILIARSFSLIGNFDKSYQLTKMYQEEKHALKILHSQTNSVIVSRKKNLESKPSNNVNKNEDELGRRKKMAFLDLLLQSTVDGKPLSNDDIREEVDTFMFEGHDTTTSLLSFALYALSQAPISIQDKIAEEQRSIFGKDRDKPTTLEDINNMKYLDLVLKEVLRLYPPVPMFGRLVEEDFVLEDGNILPKGVNIMVNAFVAHRNPKVFENPLKFDPSRWLKNDNRNPYAYVPFSAGPRNCIGQKFATLEAKCSLAKILRHFVVLPAANSDVELVLQSEAVLTSKNGVHVKFQKRNWD